MVGESESESLQNSNFWGIQFQTAVFNWPLFWEKEIMFAHDHRILYKDRFYAFHQIGHLDDLLCIAFVPGAICVNIEMFLQSCLFDCLSFAMTLSQQSLHHLCFRPTLWRKGSQPWVLSPCRRGVCRFNQTCHMFQNSQCSNICSSKMLWTIDANINKKVGPHT